MLYIYSAYKYVLYVCYLILKTLKAASIAHFMLEEKGIK